jgi:hypothetical protein
MMDPTLVILLITTITSVCGNILQYSYKSKCTKISVCCGALEINRDIQKEEEIEMGITDIYDRRSKQNKHLPKHYEQTIYEANPQKPTTTV